MNYTKRIAVITLKGLGSFLNWTDRITGYEVKVFPVSKAEEIFAAVDWADIVWLEWMNQAAVHATNHRNAGHKDIIIHVHSYEVLSGFAKQINWSVVGDVICVAKHIQAELNKQVKIEAKQHIIPNGVDLDKITFKERGPGFNVGYLGQINHKKGPMLLLHFFNELYQRDKRYKLHIAGETQDRRFGIYLKHMINEMGLQNNVNFYGHIEDVNAFFDRINYIVLTSPWESQCMAVMEAMAAGVKPVIHNFYGAKTIYTPDLLWNGVPDAVNRIIDDNEKYYTSERYREYIKTTYCLDKVVPKFQRIIDKASWRGDMLEANDDLAVQK